MGERGGWVPGREGRERADGRKEAVEGKLRKTNITTSTGKREGKRVLGRA